MHTSYMDSMDTVLLPQTESQPHTQTQPQQLPIPPINQELRGNILREMSINRKSDGYHSFKSQEELILTICRQHLLCSDTVVEQLDLKVLLSDRSLITVVNFLKERLLHESNNIKLLQHPFFLNIYKDSEQPEQSIYPKFTTCLEHMNQLHQAQAKSLSILVKNMEKMIKDKFETNQSAYSSNINTIINRIKTKRKVAREALTNIQERNKKFHKLYNDMMNNGGKHKKRSKDLFDQERKFRAAVQSELTGLTSLGEDVILYYNEVIKQESLRLEIICSGLKYYLEKFHETYSGTTPSAQAQLVMQKFKDYNSIEESSQIIIKDVGYIKDALKSEEVGFPQIKNFLIQFPMNLLKPTLPQVHPFILKFFHKLLRDVGSVFTTWQNTIAVVSIDRNLLLYDSDDTTIPNKKASFKFAIEQTKLIPKQVPLTAELKHTTPGFMYNSNQSVTLKFASQDDYDELQFYLSNQ